MRRRAWCIVVGCLTFAARAQDAPDDLASRLGLADLAAYRAALSGKATADATGDKGKAGDPSTPTPASFRDLWDHPDAWRGRRVSIEGRVVRVFRQEAYGEFPALVEAWLSTPRGDLLCMVHPQGKAETQIGSEVRFAGTYLKTIRYAGADEPRLAPLVVGDRPPAVIVEARGQKEADQRGTSPGAAVDGAGQGGLWIYGLGAVPLIAAALALAWYHSNKSPTPHRRRGKATGASRDEPTAAPDPPLEFLDSEGGPR